jgi:hypothetical protein
VALVLANGQSDPNHTSSEVVRGVNAVDASVRAEVDGQPHEPAPEEALRERPSVLHSPKRHPATAVWPAHVEISTTRSDGSTRRSDGRRAPPSSGVISFRPETGSRPFDPREPNASAAAAIAKQEDFGRSHRQYSNVGDSHPLSGSAKPPLALGTKLPRVPEIDGTPASGHPFGRTVAGFGGNASPFPMRHSLKYKDQTVGRQNQDQTRKPVSAAAANSLFDSPTQR